MTSTTISCIDMFFYLLFFVGGTHPSLYGARSTAVSIYVQSLRAAISTQFIINDDCRSHVVTLALTYCSGFAIMDSKLQDSSVWDQSGSTIEGPLTADRVASVLHSESSKFVIAFSKVQLS